jgi:multiple sugar transport system substrate-binding protein
MSEQASPLTELAGLIDFHERKRRKKMKRDRLSYLLIAIVLITSVIGGCGPTEAPPEPTPLPTSAAEEVQPTEVSEPATGVDWQQCSGEEIVFMGTQMGFQEALEETLPKFKELTGIDVIFDLYPEDQFRQKRTVALSSGNTTPDVFYVDFVGQMAEAGWLEPMEPYLSDPTLFDAEYYQLEDQFKSGMMFAEYNGAQYGLAMVGDPLALLYRKDLFQEMGLKVPETFDELYDAAMAIEEEYGIPGLVQRGKRNANTWPWMGYVGSFGGAVLDKDGNVVVDSPETIAATEFYAKILQDAGPEGAAAYDWPEVLADLQQGKAGMAMIFGSALANMNDPEKSTVVDKIGAAVFPHLPGMQPAPSLWFWNLGMNANSEHKRCAFLFLEWMTSPEIMGIMADSGTPGSRASVYERPGLIERYGGMDNVRAIQDNFRLSDPTAMINYFQHPDYPAVSEVVSTAVQDVIAGTRSAEDALKDAAQQARDIVGE